MGRKRAVQAVRELVTDGRSSTLGLFDLDPCGDSLALAEMAAVLVHQLAAATGRDAALIVDDLGRLPRPAGRSRRT